MHDLEHPGSRERRFGRDDPRFAHPRTPRDADEIVRRQAAAGYDMIKVLYGLEPPIYRQVLESALRARLPVVGHVVAEVGLERSIAAPSRGCTSGAARCRSEP